MLYCAILPVCPKSIVLFEVSHALPACPPKWSTEIKQYETMMKWYWQVLGASPAANRLIYGVTLEEKICSTSYAKKKFTSYLTDNTSTFTLKAVLYEVESHGNLKLLLQAGPPPLHYCCAVVSHSCIVSATLQTMSIIVVNLHTVGLCFEFLSHFWGFSLTLPRYNLKRKH